MQCDLPHCRLLDRVRRNARPAVSWKALTQVVKSLVSDPINPSEKRLDRRFFTEVDYVAMDGSGRKGALKLRHGGVDLVLRRRSDEDDGLTVQGSLGATISYITRGKM